MARVHHLNCISTCPAGGWLMDGRADTLLQRGRLTCHCLLVETAHDLTLVDTGFGLADVHHPASRLSSFFLALVKPEFREEMTAIRQIERMGFDPRDVRNILMTHLDFDHAGGLDDFPHAKVHLLQDEHDAAVAQKTWMDRQRFRPQQWSTRPNWKLYNYSGGESWMGFQRVRELEGVSPDIVMIPLVGHTFGHAGIAVNIDQNWLLLAGDAYFFYQELDPYHPQCTPGLRFYQKMLEKDRHLRLLNQRRLRELQSQMGNEVTVFCSHDVVEFERLAGRPASIPAERLQIPLQRSA